MTDDTNNGDVPPPPPVPAAPPPLAGAPPPIAAAPEPVPAPAPAPAQPAPQSTQQLHYTPVGQPAYPPASGGGKGGWIFLIVLAFILGAGASVLTLWLTGELWNSRSSYSSGYSGSAYGSSSSTSSSPSPSPSSSPSSSYDSGMGNAMDAPPAPSPTTSGGSMPHAVTLIGTWGPGCPSNRRDATTFYSDGTAAGDGESGRWSLNGNYLSLNNGRQTITVYWEMVGNDMARVRTSGESQTRTIYRCS